MIQRFAVPAPRPDRERGFKSRPWHLIFIYENQGLLEYKMNTAKVVTMLNRVFIENNS